MDITFPPPVMALEYDMRSPDISIAADFILL